MSVFINPLGQTDIYRTVHPETAQLHVFLKRARNIQQERPYSGSENTASQMENSRDIAK